MLNADIHSKIEHSRNSIGTGNFGSLNFANKKSIKNINILVDAQLIGKSPYDCTAGMKSFFSQKYHNLYVN